MNTKLFLSNKSQAVRLPKAVAFPEGVSEVTIVTVGKSRLITPSDAIWDDFFDLSDSNVVSDDFINSRDQPEPEQREEF